MVEDNVDKEGCGTDLVRYCPVLYLLTVSSLIGISGQLAVKHVEKANRLEGGLLLQKPVMVEDNVDKEGCGTDLVRYCPVLYQLTVSSLIGISGQLAVRHVEKANRLEGGL